MSIAKNFYCFMFNSMQQSLVNCVPGLRTQTRICGYAHTSQCVLSGIRPVSWTRGYRLAFICLIGSVRRLFDDMGHSFIWGYIRTCVTFIQAHSTFL